MDHSRLCRATCTPATNKKPLFDVSPDTVADDVGVEDETGARPVLIPDFVVRVRGAAAVNEAIVVETLGFASQGYRDRKSILVPMMRESLGGAALVEYDGYDGRNSELSRNRSFRGRLRVQISGPF